MRISGLRKISRNSWIHEETLVEYRKGWKKEKHETTEKQSETTADIRASGIELYIRIKL